MLVWDEQALLDRCRQKPERAKRLIGMFLEDAPTTLAEIKTNTASGDSEALHRSAHSLKGMAANLGALKLQEVAFDLETASTNQDINHCSSLIPIIESEFDALKIELDDFMNE